MMRSPLDTGAAVRYDEGQEVAMPSKPIKYGLTTAKHVRFVDEYLIDCNATQAAKRAGYSEKTAAAIGHKLLRKAEIQAAIRSEQDRLSRKTEITKERVLAEYAKIAFAEMGEFMTWGEGEPVFRESESLTPDQRAAVAEVALTANGFKIRLHNKTAALEALAKYLGLFIDRREEIGELPSAVVELLAVMRAERKIADSK